ncbi:hypothetical protein F5B22DRAFT_646327 [Xylaria bambusicola]|uniref:uncharacterized protein n=1 Tax=Xylaria bambusicola TaxID=326684 RepID=UPI0020078724|nr:uncharacterized protein F5B22DRAFT_646327 [Xylaria bambusicola]KAI0516979.1 hypothetical protein F5B22DRAFT_646327 [Xylaria bambusicola]
MKRQRHVQEDMQSKRHCPATQNNITAQENGPQFSPWPPNIAPTQTCDPRQITQDPSYYDPSTLNGYCSPMAFTGEQFDPTGVSNQTSLQFTSNNGGFINNFYSLPNPSFPMSTTLQSQQSPNAAYPTPPATSQPVSSQQTYELQQCVPTMPSVRLPFAMNRESEHQTWYNVLGRAPLPVPATYQFTPRMPYNAPNRPVSKDMVGVDMAAYSKPQRKLPVPTPLTRESPTSGTEINKPLMPTLASGDLSVRSPIPTSICEVEKPTDPVPAAEPQTSTRVPETESDCDFTLLDRYEGTLDQIDWLQKYVDDHDKSEEEENRKVEEERQNKGKGAEEKAQRFREMTQSASYQFQDPKASSVNPALPEVQVQEKVNLALPKSQAPEKTRNEGLVAYAVRPPNDEGIVFKVVEANCSIQEIAQGLESPIRDIKLNDTFSGMNEKAVKRWCNYLLGTVPGVDDEVIVWAK